MSTMDSGWGRLIATGFASLFCKVSLLRNFLQFQRHNIILSLATMWPRLEGSYAWCRVVFAVDTQSPHDGIPQERSSKVDDALC